MDLREVAGLRKNSGGDSCGLVFARDITKPQLAKFLDKDGLPYPGTKLVEGDPLYCYFSTNEAKFFVKNYKSKEPAIVDSVKLCSNDTATSLKNKVCISFRISRNPSVGDKFASRAGQKGIASQKWPCEDLPWTSNGMFPDIIFNPHGFPSRMTIAMMIEQMAGKSGAIHGKVHDATPFTFSEHKEYLHSFLPAIFIIVYIFIPNISVSDPFNFYTEMDPRIHFVKTRLRIRGNINSNEKQLN